MKLIIIRHGETIQNAKKIVQGQSEGFLSRKGKKQVNLLGKALRNEKINAIYTSDLIRTIDTAKAIQKYHPHLNLIKDKRLRERYFGSYENKPFAKKFDWDNLPKDIETDKQLSSRAKEFFVDLKKKHKDNNKTIVLVTHGGMKRVLHLILQEKSLKNNSNLGRIENTAISIYELNTNKKAKLHLLNSIEHLTHPLIKVMKSFFKK